MNRLCAYEEEVINLALSSNLHYKELARDLGLNHSTLKTWISQSMKNPKYQTEHGKPLSRQDDQTLGSKSSLAKRIGSSRETELLKNQARTLPV